MFLFRICPKPDKVGILTDSGHAGNANKLVTKVEELVVKMLGAKPIKLQAMIGRMTTDGSLANMVRVQLNL